MSLKAFHIFFIVASVLAILIFGGWSFYMFTTGAGVSHLLFGVLALGTCAGLIWYAKRFMEKVKNVNMS